MPDDNNTDAFYDQQVIEFYRNNGPCCAGCDWWRYFKYGKIGDCIRSAPVSAEQRISMLGYEMLSLKIDAEHIITRRDHYCGEFQDSEGGNKGDEKVVRLRKGMK